MKITRTCPFTGNVNTLEINVTQEQLNSWQNGHLLIQDAMPNLSADEREFIKTGITSEQWENLFEKAED